MSKPIASLSLDLDNKWAYLRTHGDPSWEDYPSYLGNVVPRIVRLLDDHDVGATAFVVGKDLESLADRVAISHLVESGYELANHSYNHFPWMQSLPDEEIEREVVDAHLLIERSFGVAAAGFRAPGFSWSPRLLTILARNGYAYDSSVFPTVVGPIARLYSRFRLPGRSGGQAGSQKQVFARLSDALGDLRPHRRETGAGPIIEAPVTTMPIARLPIHVTYFTFLAQKSAALARAYLGAALRLCQARRVEPSILLHPLDFLGAEDEPQLTFFPGMQLDRATKIELLSWLIDAMKRRWRVESLGRHVAEVCGVEAVPTPSAEALAT